MEAEAANPARGDVPVVAGGRRRVMRLTLGSLAELEGRLGTGGLTGLADRFEVGRFSATDIIALLAAGFRGAGEEISEEEVAAMTFEGGAVGAAEAAIRLLTAAFRGTA